MTTHLELEDLLACAHAVMGDRLEVRDFGALEAAAGRTRASVFGVDAYPSIHEKAAALLTSLVRGHALIDGNKRLGFVATLLFYELNGTVLKPDREGIYGLVMSVADGSRVDVQGIALDLAQWA